MQLEDPNVVFCIEKNKSHLAVHLLQSREPISVSRWSHKSSDEMSRYLPDLGAFANSTVFSEEKQIRQFFK